MLNPVPLSSSENKNSKSGKNKVVPPVDTVLPEEEIPPTTKLEEAIAPKKSPSDNPPLKLAPPNFPKACHLIPISFKACSDTSVTKAVTKTCFFSLSRFSTNLWMASNSVLFAYTIIEFETLSATTLGLSFELVWV